jgi:hypothetical protein
LELKNKLISRFYDHAVTDLALSETHWIKGKRLVVKRFDQSCRERNFSELMPQESDDPNVTAIIKSKKSKNKKGKENSEYTIVENGSTPDIDTKDAYVDGGEKKDAYVDGGEKKDAYVDGGEKKDAYVDGGEKKDAYVDGGEKKDAYVDDGEKKDAYVDDGEKKDAYVDGGEKKDAYVDGGEKKDAYVDDGEKKDAYVDDGEKKDHENSQDPDHEGTPIIDPESEKKESQKQSPLGAGNESTSTHVSIEEIQVTIVAECESNKEGIFFRNKHF